MSALLWNIPEKTHYAMLLPSLCYCKRYISILNLHTYMHALLNKEQNSSNEGEHNLLYHKRTENNRKIVKIDNSVQVSVLILFCQSNIKRSCSRNNNFHTTIRSPKKHTFTLHCTLHICSIINRESTTSNKKANHEIRLLW